MKIIFKEKSVKMAIFLVALLLINFVTWLVTTSNQKANLYPIDADSIGIPIIVTITSSALMLPILFIMVMYKNIFSRFEVKSQNFISKISLKIGVSLLYIFVILFAVIGITYWSFPGHYSIAVSYWIFLFVVTIYFLIDWRMARTREG